MSEAEHREPCESRGSRTVLGAPEGESPSGDSTIATGRGKLQVQPRPQCPVSDARPTQCNKSRWAMKRPGLVRALSPTRHEPDAREAETPRQNYFSCCAKNALTRFMASARASGFEPTVGEWPSGGIFTLVRTVIGRLG